jgi:predicted lipoprotein with Yx(FWY)xxD motif
MAARMKRSTMALVLVGLIAAVLAGCGGDDDDSTGGEVAAAEQPTAEGEDAGMGAAKEESPKPEQPGEAVELTDSEFGTILVDSEDRTLYLFDKEASDSSECYGACAEAWPPFVTKGEPEAGKGVEAGLLGTTKRDDGSTQVTYNGHPLYYYVDEGPGEVLCQGVDEFGGLWLVVTPQGEAVQ